MSRADTAEAGHLDGGDRARAALSSQDPSTRATALTALDRLGDLTESDVTALLLDPSTDVRRRAAYHAATRPAVDLMQTLSDPEWSVVEMAAWACGEQSEQTVLEPVLIDRIAALASTHTEALVREAAVAALGAIGDQRGLAAILQATTDKPAIRRRAVIALTPFEGPDVDAALQRALADRDWQVRDAAEELLR